MSTQDQRHSDLEDRLRRLNEIGIALSSVQNDLTALLERILLQARHFTGAEAGTLYLVKGDVLTFEIAQNDKLNIVLGGSHGTVDIPPVPVNRDSVSGYVATTGTTLNIPDVYAESERNFEGPKSYDRMTGYSTKSMLVVPMRDHEDQITGVLQLLNALDRDGQTHPFSREDESLIESLASQAAVAINNVRLIGDTEALFDAFVRVMATAIDERSPYTGGHIRRVAEMTMVVAQAVNDCAEGPFADVYFNRDEMEELRIAAWMHDIGKITTPEWIVDKPTKLTTIYDRIETLRLRFALMEQQVERLKACGQINAEEAQEQLEKLASDLAFLERANLPGEYMEDADVERLRRIAQQTYELRGQVHPCITEEELTNLVIRKGSLTDTERKKINDHASMSMKMLEQIPFTRKLRRVPEIAGAHHEKLDGSGYPNGLKAESIDLQSRILALVDIFESLSADDRPYRAEPMPRERVLKILKEMVDDYHIDRDVFDLFLREGLAAKLDELKEQMAHER